MSGAASRNKGARGQREARRLLEARDWSVDATRCGLMTEDLIATDPAGRVWSCEVKKTKGWTLAFRKQAAEQARKRKMPWMLLWALPQTSSWLVERQGLRAVVWHQARQQEGNEP